jgi:hypothetical protein
MDKVRLSTATMRQYQLLAALEHQASQYEIRVALKQPKYQISRDFASMEKKGLIRYVGGSHPKFFELTAEGKGLLEIIRPSLKNATIEGFSVLFRYHALFFQSEIRSTPADWQARLERGGYVVSSRRHYRGWQVKTEDVTVFVTSKTVWWLVKPVYAAEISEALNTALGVALDAKNRFENSFAFRLGYPERILSLSRQELAMIGGLTRYVPDGFNMESADGRLRIDHSEGPAEIETFHKQFALDDMTRIFEFQAEVARGNVSPEELKAVREFLPMLQEAVPVLRELAEALRKPAKERDFREVS